GHDPGSVLAVPEDGKTVLARAEARSATALDRLEMVRDGEVIAVRETGGDRRSASIEVEVPITDSGWLAARCRGGDGAGVRAHTSPVYMRMEGRPMRPNADTIAPLLGVLDQTLSWVRREARCAIEQQREHLAGTVEAGRRELLRRGT